jgi:hypothetical protein
VPRVSYGLAGSGFCGGSVPGGGGAAMGFLSQAQKTSAMDTSRTVLIQRPVWEGFRAERYRKFN